MRKINFHRFPSKVLLRTAALLLLFQFAVSSSALAQTQGSCAEALEKAQKDYQFGRFDAVIQRLQPCLSAKPVDDVQAIQIYRLVSLAHIRNDDPNLARPMVQEILRLNPAYTPNPQDLDAFVQMVDELRPKKKPNRRKWRLIVGGSFVSAAGIAVYVLGFKKNRQIPAPPPLPGNNE